MPKPDGNVIAVIPARYGSTRFPGKPLAMICGKPMIAWVLSRASAVQAFSAVLVATDHDAIAQAVTQYGGTAVMTRPDHPSGTDRVWEVAQQYPNAEFIFNLQGDEPLLNPRDLEDACAHLARHHESEIVTLKTPITTAEEYQDPHVVKVVTQSDGTALYFSRAPIPYARNPDPERPLYGDRHLGVYGYRRAALARFVSLPVSPLEATEQLEQLRALEAGMRITVLGVAQASPGVDTPADLARVESLLRA